MLFLNMALLSRYFEFNAVFSTIFLVRSFQRGTRLHWPRGHVSHLSSDSCRLFFTCRYSSTRLLLGSVCWSWYRRRNAPPVGEHSIPCTYVDTWYLRLYSLEQWHRDSGMFSSHPLDTLRPTPTPTPIPPPPDQSSSSREMFPEYWRFYINRAISLNSDINIEFLLKTIVIIHKNSSLTTVITFISKRDHFVLWTVSTCLWIWCIWFILAIL